MRLNVCKSLRPDNMHSRIPRELDDVFTKLRSIIFEKSWLPGEVPGDWKKENIIPIFKKEKKKTWGTTGLLALHI